MYRMPFQMTLFLDSSSANGVSSNFTVYFNPPIKLGVTKTYELALIFANIWYSWHNITAKNNKFRYSPDGSVWVNLAVPRAHTLSLISMLKSIGLSRLRAIIQIT